MDGLTGWGIALEAIGNLGEGIAGVVGSNQIAGIQNRAIDSATATSNKYYTEAKGYQQPYADIGMRNTQKMDEMVNAGDFKDQSKFQFSQNDPGYQYQLTQGNQAVQQNAASMGQMFSGATMRALAKYGNNMANQTYQQAYGRYQDQRNFNQDNLNNQYLQMNGLSNMGINANNNLTGMTTAQGHTMAGLDLSRGNVNAQRVASNVGNTQGVFKSIADVGGGLAGSSSGSAATGGAQGQYNTGMGGTNMSNIGGGGGQQGQFGVDSMGSYGSNMG
jgi:hypothetical protein